jgi:hypothetical protein
LPINSVKDFLGNIILIQCYIHMGLQFRCRRYRYE